VAASAETPPTDEMVEADVQRGRAALSQRRRTRAVQAVLAAPILAAALVGAGIVISSQGDTSAPPASGPKVGQTAGSSKGDAAVQLVSYEGKQLAGFSCDQVPEGWYLQGSNPFSLTIAPIGDNSSPDAFEGKLVVMLQSSSAPHRLPHGEPVTVGVHDGVISEGPPASTLTYDDGNGHIVQVEAWTAALGWSDEQLITFAEGVQVTADAQPGVG
jgi:hypothetical protein